MAAIIIESTNPNATVRSDTPAERRPVRREAVVINGEIVVRGDGIEDANTLTVRTTVSDYGGSFWSDLDTLLVAARTPTGINVNGSSIPVLALRSVTRRAKPLGMTIIMDFIRAQAGDAMPGGYDTFPTDPPGGVILGIDSAQHQHTVDAITLIIANATLAVDDATHLHLAAGGLTLAQTHFLAVNDATHAHLADNVPQPIYGVFARGDGRGDASGLVDAQGTASGRGDGRAVITAATVT